MRANILRRSPPCGRFPNNRPRKTSTKLCVAIPDWPVMLYTIDQLKQKGSAKTRVGRFSERNRIYHVVTKTQGNEPLLRPFASARIVIDMLRQQQDQHYATTLAFVVMPDHLHWLLQLTGERCRRYAAHRHNTGRTDPVQPFRGLFSRRVTDPVPGNQTSGPDQIQ